MLILPIILFYLAPPQSLPASAPAAPTEIVLRDFLVLDPVGRAGRSPIHTDAIEARIVAGEKITPREGDSVTLPDGSSKSWSVAKAADDGTLTADALRGGYAYARVESESDGIWLLDAAGHLLVYVNGELRTGDPYSLGYALIPVQLVRGTNHLLFLGGRGKLRAKLTRPASPLVFLENDLTTPTLVPGKGGLIELAVPVANCTTKAQAASIRVIASEREPQTSVGSEIPALGVAKQIVQVDLSGRMSRDDVELRLEMGTQNAAVLTTRLSFDSDTSVRKRTFRSHIDSSLQYYAVKPARQLPRSLPENEQEPRVVPADGPLILSLHGASVEAVSQAAAYAGLWADVVAPTNRRPFGFDWEDWGRLDALEVLRAEMADRRDERRVYLSGHSMGGHGTWQIGVTFPDRFAAIGPSAGWISFWSYGGLRRLDPGNPVIDLLQRAASPSDTLALLSNLAPRGVYILHGDADDNVPVAQAREMREKLAEFHRDFQWHEQPGAGHWWENSDEPGAECVQWPPMMDFFSRHRLPADGEVRDVDFCTASPGVSAACHWAAIEQQQQPFVVSRVKLRCDPLSRRFLGTTENVRRLSLEVSHLADGPISVTLDGQGSMAIPRPTSPAARVSDPLLARRPGGLRIHLLRNAEGGWSAVEPAPPGEKGPHRCGPFKAAFDNCFVFVIGTCGTPEENAWALEKARYDAETWWYRGNGHARILTDVEYARQRTSGNVILYGNSASNAAWPMLLADSPVQVDRGAVRIGTREIAGDDLACLFVRPLPGHDSASVGVIAGTGLPGQRLTNRIPYFVSGVAFPDCTIFRADTLTKGSEGIRAAGFFGNDWKIESGEFAFSD